MQNEEEAPGSIAGPRDNRDPSARWQQLGI